jgi:hypothetical protein
LTLYSSVVIVFNDVYGAALWLLRYGVAPALLLVAAGWSGVITFACFRAGLGMPRRRAGGATALFYTGYVGAILGWYLALNMIQPQTPWWSP